MMFAPSVSQEASSGIRARSAFFWVGSSVRIVDLGRSQYALSLRLGGLAFLWYMFYDCMEGSYLSLQEGDSLGFGILCDCAAIPVEVGLTMLFFGLAALIAGVVLLQIVSLCVCVPSLLFSCHLLWYMLFSSVCNSEMHLIYARVALHARCRIVASCCSG